MLKIIAGQYKSQKIEYPKNGLTRPVNQKVRGAIFNVLSSIVQDSIILDLFAGSGALGIEAISRGAKQAVFVDNSIEACKTIKKNIANLKVAVPTEIIKKDVNKYLDEVNDKFDIVFIDPPYAEFSPELANRALNLLKSTGVLVVSCSSKKELSDISNLVKIIQHKTYGDTQILFLSHR